VAQSNGVRLSGCTFKLGVVGPFSSRGTPDAVMTTTLSAASMAEFDAPLAGKLANSDDEEGDASTVDLYSRQTSSESEASSELAVADTVVVEGCKLLSQTKQIRPSLEDVLMSLPHFNEARSDVEEDSTEDEDAVLRIGQLARCYALGQEVGACSLHRRREH